MTSRYAPFRVAARTRRRTSARPRYVDSCVPETTVTSPATQGVGATAVELGRPAAGAVVAERGLEAALLGAAGALGERLGGLPVEGRRDPRRAPPLGHAEDDDGAHDLPDAHLEDVVRAH